MAHWELLTLFSGDTQCSSPIRSLRFSPSGDFIALAHLDGKVTVWNVLMRSPDHTFNLYSCASCPT